MDSKFFTVASQSNPAVTIKAAAGHFATPNSHISHYIDISELKSSTLKAKDAAVELAAPYLTNTLIDVIVCKSMGIISAYVAEELLQPGINVMNDDNEIYVVTPMSNTSGHFIFHENIRKKIYNKNTLFLYPSITTGDVTNRMLECLSYYGCNVVGVSAIFSTLAEINGHQIHSLFSCEDVPYYRFYEPSECEMCKEGRKLEAIINSEGYTKL